MTTQHTPELIKKYGGQISFMAILTAVSSIFRAGRRELWPEKQKEPAEIAASCILSPFDAGAASKLLPGRI
jgi:hypothetical protein